MTAQVTQLQPPRLCQATNCRNPPQQKVVYSEYRGKQDTEFYCNDCLNETDIETGRQFRRTSAISIIPLEMVKNV